MWSSGKPRFKPHAAEPRCAQHLLLPTAPRRPSHRSAAAHFASPLPHRCEAGTERNTRVLNEMYGWKGLLMDGGFEDARINLHKEFISPVRVWLLWPAHAAAEKLHHVLLQGNINSLLAKYNVPKDLDLLSIDVDFDGACALVCRLAS